MAAAARPAAEPSCAGAAVLEAVRHSASPAGRCRPVPGYLRPTARPPREQPPAAALPARRPLWLAPPAPEPPPRGLLRQAGPADGPPRGRPAARSEVQRGQRAEWLEGQAEDYEDQHEFELAAECLVEAVEVRRRHTGAADRSTLGAAELACARCNAWAGARLGAGRLTEAQELLMRAEAITGQGGALCLPRGTAAALPPLPGGGQQTLLPSQAPLTPQELLGWRACRASLRCATLALLAGCLRARGKAEAAARCAERALQNEHGGAPPPDRAVLRLNLATLLSGIGRHDTAIEHIEAAIAILQDDEEERRLRAGGTNSPGAPTPGGRDEGDVAMAVAYHNLSVEMAHLFRWGASATYLQRAASLARERLDPRHPVAAKIGEASTQQPQPPWLLAEHGQHRARRASGCDPWLPEEAANLELLTSVEETLHQAASGSQWDTQRSSLAEGGQHPHPCGHRWLSAAPADLSEAQALELTPAAPEDVPASDPSPSQTRVATPGLASAAFAARGSRPCSGASGARGEEAPRARLPREAAAGTPEPERATPRRVPTPELKARYQGRATDIQAVLERFDPQGTGQVRLEDVPSLVAALHWPPDLGQAACPAPNPSRPCSSTARRLELLRRLQGLRPQQRPSSAPLCAVSARGYAIPANFTLPADALTTPDYNAEEGSDLSAAAPAAEGLEPDASSAVVAVPPRQPPAGYSPGGGRPQPKHETPAARAAPTAPAAAPRRQPPSRAGVPPELARVQHLRARMRRFRTPALEAPPAPPSPPPGAPRPVRRATTVGGGPYDNRRRAACAVVESARRECMEQAAAVAIQRHWRGVSARLRMEQFFRRLHDSAALCLQRNVRGHRARTLLRNEMRAATFIQAVVRMVIQVRRWRAVRAAARTLARAARGLAARGLLARQRQAAVRLQRCLRGRWARAEAGRRRAAAGRLQAAWRGARARRRLATLRGAAALIAPWWRGCRQRAAAARRLRAVCALQALWRAKQLRRQLQEQQDASTRVQAPARGTLARRRLALEAQGWPRVQAAARGWLVRMRRRRLTNALLIQRMWRTHHERKRAIVRLQRAVRIALLRQRRARRQRLQERLDRGARREVAARRLGAFWRGHAARRRLREAMVRSHAATVLQAHWRSAGARQRFQRRRAAASQLQGAWRQVTTERQRAASRLGAARRLRQAPVTCWLEAGDEDAREARLAHEVLATRARMPRAQPTCEAVQVSRGTLDQPDDRPFGERAVAIRFEVRDLSIIPGHTTQDPSLDGAGAEFEGLDFSLGLLDVSNSVVFSAEDPTSPTERFHINAVHCGSIATAEFFSDHT